ncbi:hypothetical protein QUF72_09110 [Desulfobacterales bacterium HSG2]|nr:hypothetical protein [Desulfobacterales bacterium HSG2]
MREEKIYTMQEAADFLGVTYIVMRRYAIGRMINWTKPKNKYLFKESDLIEFKKGNIRFKDD